MYEVKASEILLESPIMAVRSDEVTMPGGHTASRQSIEHFGATAIVALNESGQVRMVRQYRHPVSSYLWELPAGILDESEETPVQAAARELQEEVGLAADTWHTLVDVICSPGISDEACRVFLATGLRKVPQPEPEDEEADMTAKWVDLDAAVEMALTGQLTNSIAVSGVLAASEHLRSGRALRPADAPWELRPKKLSRRRAMHFGAGNLKRPLPLDIANSLSQ